MFHFDTMHFQGVSCLETFFRSVGLSVGIPERKQLTCLKRIFAVDARVPCFGARIFPAGRRTRFYVAGPTSPHDFTARQVSRQ